MVASSLVVYTTVSEMQVHTNIKSLNSTRNKGPIDKEIGLVVGRIDRAKERDGSWWNRRQCSREVLKPYRQAHSTT